VVPRKRRVGSTPTSPTTDLKRTRLLPVTEVGALRALAALVEARGTWWFRVLGGSATRTRTGAAPGSALASRGRSALDNCRRRAWGCGFFTVTPSP